MVDSLSNGQVRTALMRATETYRERVQGKPTHKVELYQDQEADPCVHRYRVVRLDRDTFRAVALVERSNPTVFIVFGHDGSRDTCRAFLTSYGVPVLRIGGPITQAH